MPCFVPFDGRELVLSFFAFRHVGVFAEELVDALKVFSFYTEDLGCIYSSVFKSIHGNMVIWYGAWIKRPDVQRKQLRDQLVSALANLSHLGILIEFGFFESYAGESKDGRRVAKFTTGDTISMTAMEPISRDTADLSYASLALLKSYYMKNDGVAAGACFVCLDKPLVATMQLWKSLQACYSWLIDSGYRKNVRPYYSHLSHNPEYEVFKVMYVSTDELLAITLLPPVRLIGREAMGICYGEEEHAGDEDSDA
uniref:Serine incorporator 4 n=1 Tax=Anthurium amnicola TaxID=1678845 RepID=A0A1D1ZL33_9ARAE